MLRADRIIFTNNEAAEYIIEGYQLEAFPIIGGEEAEQITSKVWNQHGNSFINAFMEPYEGEIIFIIHTANKSEVEIAADRLKISGFFNPLAGVITMEIELNNGSSYKRDITLISAPIFPVGFENRNSEWFKIQLLYAANDPFWYSSSSIVNSFKNEVPLFEIPFSLERYSPIELGRILPYEIAVNEGHVEAPVTIEIRGACINPVITNITTGDFIKFKNLTMISTDVLEINTAFGQKKVTLNGENVFNQLDFSTTFFNLKRGENEIEFTDDTNSKDAAITFIYKNLFITI